MTRATTLTVLVAGALLISAPAFGQATDQPAEKTTFQASEVVIDAAGRPDVTSSKFEEYRTVVKGISMPSFRLFGQEGQLRYDLRGQNVKQNDERYTAFVKANWFAVNADFNSIIHRIGNNGRTFLTEQGPGVWRMSDTLQQAIQNSWESTPTASRIFTTYVQPLFAPSLAEGTTVDVAVVRERTAITADFNRNQPFVLRLNYDREQRHGSGGLSSNYLSYVTETPQVTEFLTQDAGVLATFDKPWGNLRASVHHNWYVDQVKALIFDSPFRATDALTATVGSGATATSVGGPASGLMVNPPDNAATSGSFGTTLKFARRTRVTGDVSLSRWTQNDQLFPYITNTAVVSPFVASNPATLPVQSLNGKIGTNSLVLAVTSKPITNLNVAVRLRRYDLNNETPRITFAGTGSWDRSFSTSNPRITVPYSFTNTRIDATAGYDLKVVTLEGGLRHTAIDRTFREVEETAETTGSLAAVMHLWDNNANLRAVYEKASRDYSGLEITRSEDASFVNPPAGLSSNALNRDGSLRFDLARRSSDRAGVNFDISPVSMLTAAFSYLRNKDTYKETVYGMQDNSYDTYTAEVTVSPGEVWNVTGFYTKEKNGSSQRQNGTSNFPAIDDFLVRLTDSADTTGATGVFTIVPQKVLVNLGARYQDMKGTARFTVNPGSSYQLARASMGGVQDIPNADNVKWTRVDASVDTTVSRKVTVTVGAWYEKYLFSDVDTVNLQNIYPSAFLLALNDWSYNATVTYVRLAYHW